MKLATVHSPRWLPKLFPEGGVTKRGFDIVDANLFEGYPPHLRHSRLGIFRSVRQPVVPISRPADAWSAAFATQGEI